MKYQDGYKDGAHGKAPIYPLGIRNLSADQGMVKILALHAPSIPDAFATTTVVGASLDPLVSEALAKDQSVETRRDSEVDPVSEAAETPQDIASV